MTSTASTEEKAPPAAPGRPASLAPERPASPAPDRNEIASVARDILYPLFLPYLPNVDPTLVTRGGWRGLAIYDDIERDTRALSVLRKRKMAPLAYAYELTAAGDAPADVAAKELVERHFKAISFEQLVVDLGDAILKGFSVAEIMWDLVDGPTGQEIAPVAVKARNQRRFRFDADANLKLLTRENLLSGEAVPDRKFIVHSVGSKDGSPYGHGLGSSIYWPCWFKREALTFWLTFTDKFAQPTARGTYPQGTPQADQDKLLAALKAIATDAAIVTPEGTLVELLEAQRSGSVDAYERLVRYLDEQISEAALGETLTTNIGNVGSMAAAGVHNGVRLELVQGDTELLANTLGRTLIAWDVAYNLSGAKPPTLKWNVSIGEDLGARADRDTKVYALGYDPSEEYIQETYGDGWTKREAGPPAGLVPGLGADKPQDPHVDPDGKADPGAGAAGRPGAGEAEGSRAAFADIGQKLVALAQRRTGAAPGVATATDRFADRLGDALAPTVSAWVAEVRRILDKSGSLEEARDTLLSAYPNLSPAQFSEAKGMAVLASSLARRAAIPSHEGRT